MAVRHPSTAKLFRAVAARFTEVREQQRIAADRMWVGALMSEFDDTEIALLDDFLTPHDRQLLRTAQLNNPRKDR